jgi:uncharacterized protein (TIGR02271 family)
MGVSTTPGRILIMPRAAKKNVAARAAIIPSWTDDDDEFWRGIHQNGTYVVPDADFDDYAPAFRYGVLVGEENDGKRFQDIESKARTGWSKVRGNSHLTWDQARPAVRDAFDRTIQLRSERLKVDKERDARAGEVKVKKKVRTQHRSIDVPVEHEEVVIERRPVRRTAATGEVKAEEIRIPVARERAKVGKETVVREEVRVGKRKVSGTQKVEGDVRREELVVENEGQARVRHTGGPRKSR